jgi:hypothetical protein
MSNKNDALATAMLAVSDEADQQSAEGTQIISAMCYEAIALQRTEHELHDDLDSADSSLGMNQRNMLGLQRNLDGICREKVREEMRRSPAPGPVLGSRLREADGTSQPNFRPTRCKTSIRDPSMATKGLKLQSALVDSDEISGPILVAFPAGSGSREISREYRRAVGKQLHDDAERRKIEKQFSDLALILAQISL